MIGVVDYGAGNMKSVTDALEHLALDHRVCGDAKSLAGVSHIILPGVGHFGSAGCRLAESGIMELIPRLVQKGVRLLGICLGLQLLFAGSEEAEGVEALGLIPGRVVTLKARRVPHMGWNTIDPKRACELLGDEESRHYYFAHSYVAAEVPAERLLCTTVIDGQDVPAVVGGEGVWGVQFHPEKSSEAGLALLRRFSAC